MASNGERRLKAATGRGESRIRTLAILDMPPRLLLMLMARLRLAGCAAVGGGGGGVKARFGVNQERAVGDHPLARRHTPLMTG